MMDWTPIYEGSELYQFKLSKIGGKYSSLSSKIGVEFFVKSLRQMLPEVYLYIVKTVQNFRIVQVNLLLLKKK